MKKKFYFILFYILLSSIYSINAQNYNKDIIIKGQQYTIKTNIKTNGEISFELYNINKSEDIRKFNLQRINQELMLKQIAFCVKDLSNEDVLNDKKFNEDINSLFYAIAINKLIEKDDDEQPIAGKLKVSEIVIKEPDYNSEIFTSKRRKEKKRINDEFEEMSKIVNRIKDYNKEGNLMLEKYSNYKKTKPENELQVKDVEIEIRDSYIETIKVNAKNELSGIEYRFENNYGIGISSRNAMNKFNKISLKDKSKDTNWKIKLSDLLNYDYAVQLLTRDFSPSDTMIKTFGGQNITLKKEKTSKLFEAIVFSDFIGIDNNKPNGLIQTEVSKRININPMRTGTWRIINYIGDGFGYLQYIKPSITISKIEQDNRSLISSTKIDSITKDSNTTYKINTFLTPINILNHQNLSLGIDLNLLFLDKPDFKYNIYINGGFRFGRTAITDSISILDINNQLQRTGDVKNYGINYFTYYPEISLHILPEERYGLYITNRWQYFRTAFQNPNLIAYDINSNIDNTKKSNWINTFELMTYVKTGFNGRIFARWRFNKQLGNRTQNFHQVQVGYSFYFLKRNN